MFIIWKIKTVSAAFIPFLSQNNLFVDLLNVRHNHFKIIMPFDVLANQSNTFFFCHIPFHLSFSPPAFVFFLDAPPRVDRHLGSIIIINLSCDQMALRFESICCSQSLLRLYCATCRSSRLNERPCNKKKKWHRLHERWVLQSKNEYDVTGM